jgi:hypothetical protein
VLGLLIISSLSGVRFPSLLFFAFLALVLGGGGALFVWCSTCFVFSKGTWRWTGYELLLASLCQAMTFVWFGTQICTWNTCGLFGDPKPIYWPFVFGLQVVS